MASKTTVAEESDLQKMLKGYDDDYDKSPSFRRAPDGTYQAVVERFDFLKGKDDHTYLKTEFRIALGEYNGQVETTLHVLDVPERFGFTKGHLETLGVEGPLSEIENNVGRVLDTPVELSVYTNTSGDKAYRNVRVERRLGSPIAQSDVPSDDIPF